MSYETNLLIECSRASSEEVKSGNFSNEAVFTNKLSQALKLEVGDNVSVERSFVNGLGAGNQDTIQFSGRRVTPYKNRKIKYTTLTGGNRQSNSLFLPYHMGEFLSYKVEEKETDNLEIRDNECKIGIGYYINSCNHPSYIQLPRRFVIANAQQSDATDWNNYDTQASGLPYFSVDISAFCVADWKYTRDAVGGGTPNLKQKVDNSRFTLFFRNEDYSAKEVTDLSEPVPVVQYQIPDANINGTNPLTILAGADYIRYRELKTIKIQEGFNTPQSIANQVKQQLNDTKKPKTFGIADPTQPEFFRPLTTTLESETYKPFPVANIHNFANQQYTAYSTRGASPLNNLMCAYHSQYFALGVKRPEIFEAGREMSRKGHNSTVLFSNEKADRLTNQIITAWDFTRENLDRLKAIFDAEALYPELWDNLDKLRDYENPGNDERPTINNSRFLHMSRQGHSNVPAKIPFPQEEFGNDGLHTSAPTKSPASAPLFFYYDKSQDDGTIPEYDTMKQNGRWPADKFVYGFAQPFYLGNEKVVIRLSPSLVGGIPLTFYTGTDPTTGINSKIWGGYELQADLPAEDMYKTGRYLGYDETSTAYGSAFVLPYSSHTYASFEGSQSNNNENRTFMGVRDFASTGILSVIQHYTQAYLGANNPILDYNTETNRFEFSQLHCEENEGNSASAGDAGAIDPEPINDNAGQSVYKINPHVDYNGFSPTFKPYRVSHRFQFRRPYHPDALPDEALKLPTTQEGYRLGFALNARTIALPNENIEPYKIFDAWGGIYFDDMGYNEEEWDNVSMWGRMGFSWEQFNSVADSDNVLNERISQENRYELYRPTTNSILDTTDTKAFIVNLYGAPMYSTMIGSPSVINPVVWTPPLNAGVGATFNQAPVAGHYPELNQATSSLTLTARNLPKSMINPFYTIRSNILSSSEYLGSKDSGMKLPVVGIVDRYGAQGDFYFGSPSDLSFTITKQTMIADIETSICNPDGTFAEIDDNSGVIYKVRRARPAPVNVFEELVQEEKKKK